MINFSRITVCLLVAIFISSMAPVIPPVMSATPQVQADISDHRGQISHHPGEPLPAVSTSMIVVGGIILGALVLFVTELFPLDITALGIMITLILLEPWTGVSAVDGISGFSSTATITVMAMFMLGEGIRRTGVIHVLGNMIVKYTGSGLKKQLASIVGIVSPTSGILNNTAVVAILLPMVSNIADSSKRSPSKLLIPLSYASMFGGMLTLVGTSTNLLASDLSARLLDHPIGMFEFTQLGVLVTIAGGLYLVFVAPFLLTDRVRPKSTMTDRYELREFLTRVRVSEKSPFVGSTVETCMQGMEQDADIVQLIRSDQAFIKPISDKQIQTGDELVIRSDRETLLSILDVDGLELVSEEEISDEDLKQADDLTQLVEVIVAPGSSLVGESLSSTSFRSEYDATVLALRHGEQLQRTRMDEKQFEIGDTLLIQASPESLRRLRSNPDLIVAQEIDRPEERRDKTWTALAIVFGVIGLAGAGLLNIVTASLAGALAMVVTGCLRPREMYRAVRWDIIFLLASLIPLGIAMENCGAADLIAGLIARTAQHIPLICVLGLLYFVTAGLTNLISNNASVLLMIPIAIDTAMRLGTNPYAFLLAVTFAASTAFMTPMGYQTNLFVHGPGGYKFRDYLIVGTPLQIIIGIVTTLGIAYWWPL